MTAMPPAGERHPDEALSALVDGSLGPDEQAAVREHVAGCPACLRQVEQLQAVRDIMRQLPLVDPPFGFFERTLRQGPRPRSTAMKRLRRGIFLTVVALVAVLGVVAIANRRRDEVTPQVAQVLSDYRSGVAPAAPQPALSAPQPVGGLPSTLGPYSFVGMVLGEQDRYAVYSDGQSAIGITWADGELDPREHSLPAGATEEERSVDNGRAYHVAAEDVSMLFVERGGRVYTLVAETPELLLEAVSGDLPRPGVSPSVGERAQSAGKALLEAFGLGG